MTDVFVSYARSTEPVAEQVCKALRDGGFSVWRDNDLPAHRAYGDVIAERLNSAKAVVVLWSAEAAQSQWVRAEADAARSAGTLVQASVDRTVPPMPFNQIQCADLAGWNGSGDAPGYRKVEASVAALARAPAAAPQPRARRAGAVSICVLPFANMSGDPEQEYFSDGISEDITTDLSKVSALEVIARNTAFGFKGMSVDVPEVAAKLGVSHVLEGSVRKAGNRVRINAQLIDGASGAHVWADRFDRDLTDIFAIQDELSKSIVEALKVKLLPEEKEAIVNRGTTSADAYNLYLMARSCWVSGNHGDRRREERVIRICRRAVEVDSDYAQAWALMALAQVTLRFGYGQACDDGMQAADRALALDPENAEARCAKARALADQDRLEEAFAQIEPAVRLHPESWEVNKEAARLHMRRGQIAEARHHYENAVAIMESDYHGWGMLLTCCQGIGDRAGAKRAATKTVQLAEAALEEDPSNGAVIGFGVAGLAALGEAERAREWMERALLVDPDNLNMRYNFACALAANLGDKEGALALLERNFLEIQGRHIGLAETDPDLDSIRGDPRFQHMVSAAKKRLGISL